VTPPDVVAKESNLAFFHHCQQTLPSDQLRTCHVGNTADPTGRVALVGDSHAGHWVPMMDALGKQLGWDVVVHTKGSCPASDARRVVSTETGRDWQAACERWNQAVDESILGDPRITDVFVGTHSSLYAWTSPPDKVLARPSLDGFTSMWRRWLAAGKRIHVIADVPTMSGDPIPSCVALHSGNPEKCAVPRKPGLPRDVAVDAARDMHDPRVQVIDLTAEFCDAARCYARVGDVIVYRDRTHVSVEYSRLLAPYVREQLVSS